MPFFKNIFKKNNNNTPKKYIPKIISCQWKDDEQILEMKQNDTVGEISWSLLSNLKQIHDKQINQKELENNNINIITNEIDNNSEKWGWFVEFD